MSSETDIAAQGQLSELAELSLEVSKRLADAMEGAEVRDLVRLADAFSKVGRCMRMCIALSSRLARGEALAPAQRDRDLDADEADPDDEADDDEAERFEGLERETLFDRLPSGDPAAQVASIAHGLASATRALPDADRYRARCDAIVAGARRDLPRRLPDPGRGPPKTAPVALGAAIAPNRSRGSPG